MLLHTRRFVFLTRKSCFGGTETDPRQRLWAVPIGSTGIRHQEKWAPFRNVTRTKNGFA